MGGKTYYRVLSVILAVLLGILIVAFSATLIRDLATPDRTAEEIEAEADRIIASLTPSPECEVSLKESGTAFYKLNNDPAATNAELDAFGIPPLDACQDADDWLRAAEANPWALGFTHIDAIDSSLLVTQCNADGAPRTRVCIDAAAEGMLD